MKVDKLAVHEIFFNQTKETLSDIRDSVDKFLRKEIMDWAKQAEDKAKHTKTIEGLQELRVPIISTEFNQRVRTLVESHISLNFTEREVLAFSVITDFFSSCNEVWQQIVHARFLNIQKTSIITNT